jgi:hypothetical protein
VIRKKVYSINSLRVGENDLLRKILVLETNQPRSVKMMLNTNKTTTEKTPEEITLFSCSTAMSQQLNPAFCDQL